MTAATTQHPAPNASGAPPSKLDLARVDSYRVASGGTRGGTAAGPPASTTATTDPATDASGIAADATGATATPPLTPSDAHEASAVAARLAASVGRAISSVSRDPGASDPPATGTPATGTPAMAAASDAALTAGASPAGANSGFDFADTAMSPLEQAVHDLIGRFSDRDPHARDSKTGSAGDFDTALAPLHAFAAFSAPQAPAAAAVHSAPTGDPVRSAQPIQIPEPPANPSHVHLVVDDGPERVVVTVAVRGSEVHVALRGSDDATTAALARNAGSLDHAMRARGLALTELTTEREPPQQRQPSNHQEPEPRERRKPDAEPFTLEETP